MTVLLLATQRSLLALREGSPWTVDVHLEGLAPACVAVDRAHARAYCGTSQHGLWRSDDGARSWHAVPAVRDEWDITAVAVGAAGSAHVDGEAVYVGTEPSAMFRSVDAGRTWSESVTLGRLRSAATWSFPPRPETHHVRWIEPDATVPDRVFVAIEAGALVRSLDGGRTWEDRTEGGPYDTHTAATHPLARDRLYSAAGDGYFETLNAGGTWRRRVEGLRHRYLVGIAVDPRDPETVVVSAAAGAGVAYRPSGAETFVYRSPRGRTWTLSSDGLPPPRGTTASRFAVDPDAGTIYAAKNRGVYRSEDAGEKWTALDVAWGPSAPSSGVYAAALLREPR